MKNPILIADKVPEEYEGIGLTLLDYFAGQALAGSEANTDCDWDDESIANFSYNRAEAMLEEREKRM